MLSEREFKLKGGIILDIYKFFVTLLLFKSMSYDLRYLVLFLYGSIFFKKNMTGKGLKGIVMQDHKEKLAGIYGLLESLFLWIDPQCDLSLMH